MITSGEMHSPLALSISNRTNLNGTLLRYPSQNVSHCTIKYTLPHFVWMPRIALVYLRAHIHT